jgi:SET domain-containing protein
VLLVPCHIKPSKLHGMGLFAAASILKGRSVWSYSEPTDYRLTIEEAMNSFCLVHGYRPIGKNYIEMPGDGALFMNHSFEPNLTCAANGDMFANQDIATGDEITSNYFEFDQDPHSGGPL